MPSTEDTIFRHASNTKAIVSVVTLRLIEDGRLSLDDRVADWLPWFTPRLADGRKPEITIRLLMTHTSGLSFSFLEPEGNAYATENVPQGISAESGTLEEALRSLAAVPQFYEPGAEWRYSLSTAVLGAVAEQAAGMRLEDAVRRYVTGPLGMTSTTFHVTDVDRLSVAYRDAQDGEGPAVRLGWRRDVLPLGTGVEASPARAVDPDAYPSGGGGMSGTAGEYLRFLEVLRSGGAPLISQESVDLLTHHAIGDLRAWIEGEGWGFGHGVGVLLDPEAAETPQHAGTWQWGGVLGNHWFVDPVENLTVVVLTNTAVAGVIGEFPADVRDAIYGEGDHPRDASGALRNGARVSAQTMMDPGLQSQDRFFGVLLTFYGAVFWLAAHDLVRYGLVLQLAVVFIFLARRAQFVSVALYDWPPLLVGLLFAAEIIPPPLALIWYRTVVDG